MTYLKFFNSKIHHILTSDQNATLCNISNTSSDVFESYAETDYPLPQKSNSEPANSILCPKCHVNQNSVTDVTDKTPF